MPTLSKEFSFEELMVLDHVFRVALETYRTSLLAAQHDELSTTLLNKQKVRVDTVHAKVLSLVEEYG